MLATVFVSMQWLVSVNQAIWPSSGKRIPNDRFVEDYARESAKLRELYNNCVIRFKVEVTNTTGWSGTYYAKQGKYRLDKIGWGASNAEHFYLAFPRWPFSLLAVRHEGQGWLKVALADPDYETQRLIVQVRAWPLLEILSVNDTLLPHFLSGPLVREYTVWEIEDGGKRLIRIDFRDTLTPPGRGSLWLDPVACWAIARGEWASVPEAVSEGNLGRRWEVLYRLSSDTIPYLEMIKVEAWSGDGKSEPVWHNRVILKVIEFSPDVPDDVFSVTALGFSGWTALKVYWQYYRLNIACFAGLSILSILLCLAIAYRRYQRWRLARTASSSGTAA